MCIFIRYFCDAVWLQGNSLSFSDTIPLPSFCAFTFVHKMYFNPPSFIHTLTLCPMHAKYQCNPPVLSGRFFSLFSFMIREKKYRNTYVHLGYLSLMKFSTQVTTASTFSYRFSNKLSNETKFYLSKCLSILQITSHLTVP